MFTPIVLVYLLLALNVVSLFYTLYSLGELLKKGPKLTDMPKSLKITTLFVVFLIGSAYYVVVTTFGGATGYLLAALWLSSALPSLIQVLGAGRIVLLESRENLHAALWVTLFQTILLTLLAVSYS